MKWIKAADFDKATGKEAIGVQYIGTRMVREPFITFWSPSLGRFYGNPTHCISIPELIEFIELDTVEVSNDTKT